MKKEKKTEIEFVRVVCAIGIMVYHFACAYENNYGVLYKYINGDWGDVLVTIFFIISGGMLYLNNQTIGSLILFYYKRFKTIFPLFYLVWLLFFALNALKHGLLLYKGHAWTIILSLFGIDGYLFYLVNSYYYIGEWFLGALIILYILYPCFLRLFKINKYIFFVILSGIYIAQSNNRLFAYNPNPFRNIISCAYSFYLGMILYSNINFVSNKLLLLVSLTTSILLLFVDVGFILNSNISSHLLGICLFIILLYVGGKIKKNGNIGRVIMFCGGISYPFFLIQHQLVTFVAKHIHAESFFLYCGTLAVSVFICGGGAFCLNKSIFWIFNRNFYKSFEHLFID